MAIEEVHLAPIGLAVLGAAVVTAIWVVDGLPAIGWIGRAGVPGDEQCAPDQRAATPACTASRLGESRHGDEIDVGRHHHRTGRRVLRRADPGAAPDRPGRSGARPGRRGRVGRASYRYHDGARRSFRHGGGCVPPPRAQRVRGTDPRALGAGDRSDALRVRRRRVDASVASPAAPASLLAQGRDGRAGDRLDAGGIRPGPGLAGVLVGVALLLLVESFGRDVVWLALRSRARRVEVGAS